ncbi:MAG: protein phosphatase 2C domain-containing protein [Gemmataceae bacterium]
MTRFDQIEHACLTDVGIRRSHNQDNYAVQLVSDDEGWQQRGHLFLVADGMGAHAVGEKASEQAAHVIPHIYQKHAQQGPATALRRSFVEANATIHTCGQQNREFEGMGTTSTALLLRPDGAWIGHVGDSRCYRVRDGIIEQLSYDHSLLWEYARLQHLDPDEVEDIPTNVIHRCLGPEALVQVDVEGPHPIQQGDVFVLCSDGLSGQVTDPEIGAVASVLPPAEACRFLVDLANLRGGPDNITVVVVHVGGQGSTPTTTTRRRRGSLLNLVPWWALSLVVATGLAIGATILGRAQSYILAILLFIAALAGVIAGMIGLFIHYQDEQNRPESDDDEDRPPPRTHRRRPCKIERPLLDKLVRALRFLRQRADEKHWEPDWNLFQEHQALADELLAKGDLASAFREYCRAMLPLTRAQSERRQKEEVFTPVWDKSR